MKFEARVATGLSESIFITFSASLSVPNTTNWTLVSVLDADNDLTENRRQYALRVIFLTIIILNKHRPKKFTASFRVTAMR